jgi:hypothetical protein
MKRFLNPLRIAAILLVLYTIGHTAGALLSTPRFGFQSDAVLGAMKSVHFQANGSDSTWYGFYLGFGAVDSIYFLLSAFIAWHIGGLDLREQQASAPIIWALFVSHLMSTIVVFRYFFLAPMLFSAAITALLGYQCLRPRKTSPLPSAGSQ